MVSISPQVVRSYFWETLCYSQGKKSPSLEFFQWDPGFIVLIVFSGSHPRISQDSFSEVILWYMRVCFTLSLEVSGCSWCCQRPIYPLTLTSVGQMLLTMNTCNCLYSALGLFFCFSFFHVLGKMFVLCTSQIRVLENGNPLQYSCLENPMGGGDW